MFNPTPYRHPGGSRPLLPTEPTLPYDEIRLATHHPLPRLLRGNYGRVTNLQAEEAVARDGRFDMTLEEKREWAMRGLFVQEMNRAASFTSDGTRLFYEVEAQLFYVRALCVAERDVGTHNYNMGLPITPATRQVQVARQLMLRRPETILFLNHGHGVEEVGRDEVQDPQLHTPGKKTAEFYRRQFSGVLARLRLTTLRQQSDHGDGVEHDEPGQDWSSGVIARMRRRDLQDEAFPPGGGLRPSEPDFTPREQADVRSWMVMGGP